jgi:hypothetical protein
MVRLADLIHNVTHKHSMMTKPGRGRVLICSMRGIPWANCRVWYEKDSEWVELHSLEQVDSIFR